MSLTEKLKRLSQEERWRFFIRYVALWAAMEKGSNADHKSRSEASRDRDRIKARERWKLRGQFKRKQS